MNKIILALILAVAAKAQITVAVSPVPQQVLSALHLRAMGMDSLFLVNTGSVSRTINPEQIYTSLIAMQPVDPTTAQLILTQRQNASSTATAARWLSYGGQAASIALAILSKANIPTAFWVSASSTALPQLESLFEGAVPSIAGYTAQVLNQPVILAPSGQVGSTATRTIFIDRARWKTGATASVTIQ